MNDRTKALEEALRSTLNFIENTESELGVILGCGDKARAALAASQTAPDCQQATSVTAQAGEAVKWPARCDGIEQDAFEAWAKSNGYDMAEHPLHWLFLNARTSAARHGWAAGLAHAVDRMRFPTPGAKVQAEQEPVAWVMPGDDCENCDGFIDAMAYPCGEFTRPLYAAPPAITVQEAQCCACGKRGLSTAEDGGPECELADGRWTCSRDCYERAVDGATVQEAARVLLDSHTVQTMMAAGKPLDLAAALRAIGEGE